LKGLEILFFIWLYYIFKRIKLIKAKRGLEGEAQVSFKKSLTGCIARASL
jgi:hypothetical protein